MKTNRKSANKSRIELRGGQDTWLIAAATDQPAIVHLGLDTEGTGRKTHNLLASPLRLSWMEGTAPMRSWSLERTKDGLVYHLELDKGRIDWQIRAQGDALVFTIALTAWCPIYDLALTFDLNQQFCPTAVLPHDFTDDFRLLPPYLFIAPDHGHLYAEIQASTDWHATFVGDRSTHALRWTLRCGHTFENGHRAVIRFSPIPIAKPAGLDDRLWKRIRRPWLNQFQLNAHANDVETPMMFANNVLSNPAIALAALYADSMLFLPEPLPKIHLARFLRHMLDDWFKHRVMVHGNIAFFGKSDTYLVPNPMLICAAWDYIQITHDREWLKKQIVGLQLVADFVLRRDQDRDGLTESIHSGNAWSLRDPDRSDFYLESINFGHKNAYTNAWAYRAYHCMADLLKQVKYDKAARVYLKAAAQLKTAYTRTFLNPRTGMIAGWISQDGKMHDAMFPFVNGRAIACGLVECEQGRAILKIIMAKLRELEPRRGWRWGLPINLLPIPDHDLMQPGFGVDCVNRGIPAGLGKAGITTDDFGLLRLDDPDGTKTFRGAGGYNGAIQSALTADVLMGLIAVGMDRDVEWILEPMLQAAEAGEFQNGLHVKVYEGAEHHDWDGNPTGYEGYLPENWYFLIAALLRDPKRFKKLYPFVSTH